jgi:hypothetical protein
LGSKSYGEVAFNYDEDQGSGKLVEKGGGEPTEEEVEGGDEPFIAPPELDIPINMTLVWTTFDAQEAFPDLSCGMLFIGKHWPHFKFNLKALCTIYDAYCSSDL